VILFTTGRRPTARIRSLVNELSYSIPKCVRLNRGKLNLEALAETCFELGCDKALIMQRWMGAPGKVQLLEFTNSGLAKMPPLIYLAEVKLRREYGTRGRFQAEAITVRSEANSELIRLAKSLSNFFELPLITAPSASSCQAILRVLPNSRWKAKVVLESPPSIREVGPSFVIKNLEWENFEEDEKS